MIDNIGPKFFIHAVGLFWYYYGCFNTKKYICDDKIMKKSQCEK